MSALSDVCLKECTVKLIRLTKEEIEKHTGKTYQVEEEIEDATNLRPTIFVRKDIQSENIMDIETAQDNEDPPNIATENDFIPNMTPPQNDSINHMEIDETQISSYNMHVRSDELGSNMIYYQPYAPNDMDIDATLGNGNYISPHAYIPTNIPIKQEIQEDYDIYTTQEPENSQIMIKQEVIDESYNQSYMEPGHQDMYDEYIHNDNMINQPTQSFGNMQPYVNPEAGTTSNGCNPHIIIKQEIFDDGNIEVYTDVLRPLADQEYEDGSPW